MLTGLVAGTYNMRYMTKEPLYRIEACDGASRAALGALALLLVLVLLLLFIFPMPSS
jgi:hypothetical protein